MKKILNRELMIVIFSILMLIIGYIGFRIDEIKIFNIVIIFLSIIFIILININKKIEKSNIDNAGVVYLISWVLIGIMMFSISLEIAQKNSFLLFLRREPKFNLFIIIIISSTYLYIRDKKLKSKKDN